jgi:hypothetical protein
LLVEMPEQRGKRRLTLYPENVHVVGYAFLLFACKTVPPGFELVCIKHLNH